MNPLHKAEEEHLLVLFRRIWPGAIEIASAEINDRPDVRGVLVGGRTFGMEITTLTENARSRSDRAIAEWLSPELEAAAAAAGVNASFGVVMGDWQANRIVKTDRAHRAAAAALAGSFNRSTTRAVQAL